MIIYRTIPADMPRLHRLHQLTGYVTSMAFRSNCMEEMKYICEMRDDNGTLVVVWDEIHHLPLMNAIAEAWFVLNDDTSVNWGIKHIMKGALE